MTWGWFSTRERKREEKSTVQERAFLRAFMRQHSYHANQTRKCCHFCFDLLIWAFGNWGENSVVRGVTQSDERYKSSTFVTTCKQRRRPNSASHFPKSVEVPTRGRLFVFPFGCATSKWFKTIDPGSKTPITTTPYPLSCIFHLWGRRLLFWRGRPMRDTDGQRVFNESVMKVNFGRPFPLHITVLSLHLIPG